MILLNLKLENFKRYENYYLEFQEGLIGIVGKNGSGKSTIFEAILFALYGELKNKGYKEVIRNSNASTKDVVLVELEFEFESVMYKVSREFRGKALSANAKFYKENELITTGAKEVTASIVSLTKMSKDAFLHTLFASQKELTNLSTRKPEDRKKMIRKLLGLEKIDFIEDLLIKQSRDLKREITAFAEVLLGDDEVKVKKEYIEQYTVNKNDYEKESIQRAKEVNSLKLEEVQIQEELKIHQSTKEKKRNYASQCELLQNSINSHIRNKTKLNEDVNTLVKRQEELQGLQSIKEEYISLHDVLKEQESLKGHHIRKEGLTQEQTNLREQYLKSKHKVDLLKEETKEHKELIQKEEALEKEIEELKQKIYAKQREEKTLVQEIAGEDKLIANTKNQIETIKELGRDSNCPTCTRPLRDEYDKVLDSLQSTIEQTKKDKIQKSKEQLENIVKQREELEERFKKINHEHFELSKRVNLIESKKRDLIQEEEYFEKIKKHGIKNKAELAKLEQYSYDSSFHLNLIEQQKKLKEKYEYVLSLETMLVRLDKIKDELKTTTQTIESLSTKYNDLELEYKAIDYDEVKHKEKEKEYAEVKKQKEDKITVLNKLKVQVATIQGQIQTIQQSLDDNNKQLAKVQIKKDDLQDYEKIKLSLGDFKTKLNAKIAPRISSFASSMYSIITKGKYQHIEVSNDFDFYIYDEGKKYPIERFSGGEIDLANLVLRIAISKTLTELSGTSTIGFLAFDEVFGSQDESRRIEILEAFHTIKEQYRQIFLISHEIEVKEMFESIVEL
ncbi:SMC family ATPase [Poseidonibacter lekithochrous]|uniref:AAA family ATPase n=1 Tax=Poseidonibacter TaxID=2321187 RepID=UPI001C08C5EB|nr:MULTISPECIES: SMC family ATPase [Poseidonibacter]MBU3013534.1 SMC family ATPase [Poseidonibacter lekithochrous]MDO6826831.1 SMC family ATPase [Poseidonibacter sp. 1_MG-2023]